MLKVAAAILAMLVLSAPGQDGSRYTPKVTWNSNPEPDIAGYRIHWGTESGHYGTSIDVGKTLTYKFDLERLQDPLERYYTVVTAYNTFGLESLPSNELALSNFSPSKPRNLRVD
jgi:hypothetical protein